MSYSPNDSGRHERSRLPTLIAFRAVQGLSAGAVQPMAITIVGDISSGAGPTLGGVFSEFVSWRLLITTPLISVGVGAILIGLTSYVPTFLEDVEATR